MSPNFHEEIFRVPCDSNMSELGRSGQRANYGKFYETRTISCNKADECSVGEKDPETEKGASVGEVGWAT